MSFFKSDIVQEELKEISTLQEEIYTKMYAFSNMNKEDKLYHVEVLEKLLTKQRILYTRMSLSDDPEAKKMKQNILDSAQMMGLPSGADMNMIFNNMSRMLDVMKQQIDNGGEDQ